MRTKFLLSENKINSIVNNTIIEIQKDNFKTVFGNLFNELNVQKGLHIRNMKKMNESKRQVYLEEMMDNYVLDLFPRTNYIHEQFDKKFTDNILLESTNHSFRTLYNFFDFLKSSVLYECGFLNRRNFNIPLNEQGFLDSVGNVINKGVQMGKDVAGKVLGKDVVNKGIEIGKKVVQTVKPYVTKFLDSEFARWVPGVQLAKVAYDANKIYQNWEKIKKMTFEDWVEEFRNFLNGVTGIALQIVLALTGVGNIANWIVNGLLLIYDFCYQGIGKGNWNWYNIVTSAIAIVGTGVAAAAFKPAKAILGGVKKAADIAPALAGGPTLTQVLPYIKLLGQNMGKVIGWVSRTFTTFTTKFPMIGRFLKPLKAGISKIQGFLDDVVKGFKKYFNPVKAGEKAKLGQSTLQNAPTPKNIKAARTGGAHFSTADIAKKLTATTDKTLAKKLSGGLKKYYQVAVGDTLDKILKILKPYGVNSDILKQLNYGKSLEIKPGNQIRVA
jgi:hypothetical protein